MEETLEGASDAEDDMPCLQSVERDPLIFEVAALIAQRALSPADSWNQGLGVVARLEEDQGGSVDVCIVRYSLPKEAVVNLLRLPATGCQSGEQVLCYTYFLDELRHVPIALADYLLPHPMARTPGGMAVLGLTGTQVDVRAVDNLGRQRARQFLDDKLKSYELPLSMAYPASLVRLHTRKSKRRFS